jgi:hypothetical protein
MICESRFFWSCWGGFEQDFLADGAHFLKDGFELPVVGYCLPEKVRLGFREGHADSLGVDLARPAPIAGMVGRNAAMGQPSQGGDFFFEGLESPLQFSALGGL